MASEMVELVAKVIAPALFDGGAHVYLQPEALAEAREHVFEKARAAIKAMREPTLKMQNAGWQEIDRQGFQTEDTEVAPIFRAMIDASLGETSEHEREVA